MRALPRCRRDRLALLTVFLQDRRRPIGPGCLHCSTVCCCMCAAGIFTANVVTLKGVALVCTAIATPAMRSGLMSNLRLPTAVLLVLDAVTCSPFPFLFPIFSNVSVCTCSLLLPRVAPCAAPVDAAARLRRARASVHPFAPCNILPHPPSVCTLPRACCG